MRQIVISKAPDFVAAQASAGFPPQGDHIDDGEGDQPQPKECFDK